MDIFFDEYSLRNNTFRSPLHNFVNSTKLFLPFFEVDVKADAY